MLGSISSLPNCHLKLNITSKVCINYQNNSKSFDASALDIWNSSAYTVVYDYFVYQRSKKSRHRYNQSRVTKPKWGRLCKIGPCWFLQGSRGCVGREFAETEMKMLLCCLLNWYTVERDLSVEGPERLTMWRLVLRPRDGVSLKAGAVVVPSDQRQERNEGISNNGPAAINLTLSDDHIP